MFSKSKILAAILSAAVISGGATGCKDDEGTERWATTEDTNVAIDWDKVNQAYKDAEGPEDLEKRINEIYEGKEVISISVQDGDAKTQVVTGFFDKNQSGAVDEGEKIFTIKRDITGEGAAQYQTQGYGHYGYYHSPMLSIASGMILGSMLSSAFSPRYMPMYTQPYTTSAARAGSLGQQRSSYRAANPSRFSKPSKTGRSYGGSPSKSRGGGGFRGGGRFGLARKGRTTRPELLTA